MSNEGRSRHCPVWDHHFIPLGQMASYYF